MSVSAFLGAAISQLDGKLFWHAIPFGWMGWQVGWRQFDARLMIIPVALLFAAMLSLLIGDLGLDWVTLFVATQETLIGVVSIVGSFAVARVVRREFDGIGRAPRPAVAPRRYEAPVRRAIPANGLYGHIRRNTFKSLALFAVFLLMFELLAFCLIAVISARHGEVTGVLTLQDVKMNVMQGWRNGQWLQPLSGALIWLGVAWLFYRPALQRAFDAKPLGRLDCPQLYNQVESLAIASGLPTPKILIVDSERCNAFAAGFSPATAVIGVTRGLLQRLDRSELEAVLAHEMTHIANRDIRLMAVATLCTGIVFRVAWVLVLHNLKPGFRFLLLACCGAFFIWQVLALVAWGCVAAAICVLMTKLAISRAREFLADAGAIELTKNPQALISAMQKISGSDDIDGLDYACQAMMFSPVGAPPLFSPQPSLNERIAALRGVLPSMFDDEQQPQQTALCKTQPGAFDRAKTYLPDLLSFLRSLSRRRAFYAEIAALQPPDWVSRPSILAPAVFINLVALMVYAAAFDPALLQWRPTPTEHPEIERVRTPGANSCFPSDVSPASAPKPFTPIVFDEAKSLARTCSAEEAGIYEAWLDRHLFDWARGRCPISNECSRQSGRTYLVSLDTYMTSRRKATEQLYRDYGVPGLAFAQNFFDTPLDRELIADIRSRLAVQQINFDKFDLANVAALDLMLTKTPAEFIPCEVGAASVKPGAAAAARARTAAGAEQCYGFGLNGPIQMACPAAPMTGRTNKPKPKSVKPAPAAKLSLPQPSLGACHAHHDAVAILYHTYGGGFLSNYRVAADPGTFLGRNRINVPKRDAPVYVILVSYGPTEWELKIEPGAKIAAILAIGNRPQIVSNVPPGTDVAFATLADGAGGGCPAKADWRDPIATLGPLFTVDEHYTTGSGTCEMFECGNPSTDDAEPAPMPSELVRTSAKLISAYDAPEDHIEKIRKLAREMRDNSD